MKYGILLFCGLTTIIGYCSADVTTTWMCRGWPHALKCQDSSKLEIVSVEFEPLGSQCETREGLAPSALLSNQLPSRNKCTSSIAFESASKMCKDQTACILSDVSLFSEPCNWPDNTMLRINFRCQQSFTCPRDILAISTQRYSKNLHRRPAAWCRDPIRETSPVFLMPWARHGETRNVYEFSTLTSFVLGRPSSVYRLPVAAAGTSLVAYDGHLYYVKDRTRNLTKYNLQSRRKVAECPMDNALYHHEVEYSGLVGSSDIDLAVDENGLWAIYSTVKSKGNVVISHMSTDDLSIQASWETDIPRNELLNTFMVCGILYAINKETRQVYKKFDTGSNVSSELPPHVNITLPWQETTSVNYSPRDNTLYVWSTSQAIMFTLDMEIPAQPSEGSSSEEEEFVEHTPSLDNDATSGDDESFHTLGFENDASVGSVTPWEEEMMTERITTIGTTSCQPRDEDDMLWPATEAGMKATLCCPDGARGHVTWKCIQNTDEIFWDTAGPNFEKCSTWTIAIDEQLRQENSSAAVEEIAQELSDTVFALKSSDNGLKGHDLRHVTAIMGEISNLAKEAIVVTGRSAAPGEIGVKEKKERALQLNEALLDSGSNLVDSGMTETWKSLSADEKHQAGNAIMDTVEESAFLVAAQEEEDFDNTEMKTYSRVVEKENILLGIKVQKVEGKKNGSMSNENVTFPDESVLKDSRGWQNITDSIQISSKDIESNELNGKTKVVFALYDRLAELVDGKEVENESSNTVNSRIVSATIQSTGYRVKLKRPAIITLQHIKGSNDSHTCVYWNNKENSPEKWLKDGCTVLSSNWTHTVCACNHLTSFAVLVNHRGFVLDEHVLILDLLTWVGLSASLGCLAVCIATFIYFKSLHCTRTTIHTNLCLCLFMSQLIFLAGIDLYEFPIACSVIAGVLHYFFLATFMWMALEGFQLYVMLIEVFERNTNIAFYYLAGYGVPAVFVALSAGLNPKGYGTETACWLKTEIHGSMGTIGGFTPFIWAFIGPASLVAMGNIVFLALTAITMYRHGRKYIYYSKLRAIRSALRGTLALLCLLGTTWALGILWWWDGMLILQYLFCICNAFQGVYIFIFHCLMHNKVRYEYRKLLSQCIGDNYTDLPNTSSLTMKYSGMRRRSTQSSYPQKRKNSSIVKGTAHPTYYDEKLAGRNGSLRTNSPGSFKDASKFFTKEDRANMQILLTRRDSLQHALAFQQTSIRPEGLAERHSFSSRSNPGRYSPMKARIQNKKRHRSHVEEAAPLRRSQSERRHYKGKYNAPVSEGVTRLLVSSGTIDRVPVPCRYNPPGQYDAGSSMERCTSLRSNRDARNGIEHSIPTSPVLAGKPTKEMKMVDKRLARFKKMQSTPLLGRSRSWNAAVKKRRELRRLETVQPSNSVPDLMSQLSAKIESRNVSNVLLMYLDKDGTLNRSMTGRLKEESGDVGEPNITELACYAKGDVAKF